MFRINTTQSMHFPLTYARPLFDLELNVYKLRSILTYEFTFKFKVIPKNKIKMVLEFNQ